MLRVCLSGPSSRRKQPERGVKLELAELNHGYNHFAVKSQIYLASLKRAMELLSAFNQGNNGLLA
jgi:hypothetical protein